ncbi:MAG: hypothetical protein L3J70_07010 [Gammaproteobacteria bacterium]|nr:hypothetical protein [Gammaproteobacteria bacterium]
MSFPSLYHIENGKCYVLLEDELIGREKQNLILATKLANEKIEALNSKMDSLVDDTEEYDDLQDEKNDLEFMISDFEDRFEIILNKPS